MSELSTPDEIAAALGITVLALIRFAKKHRVPLIEITRGVYRLTPAAVDALYAAKGIDPPVRQAPAVPETPPPPEEVAPQINIAQMATASEQDILAGAAPWVALSGIYFLIRSGRVVYVGQSINIHQRLDEHRKKGRFERFFILPCEPKFLRKLEEHYIRELRPEENNDTMSQSFRGMKQNNRWEAVYV